MFISGTLLTLAFGGGVLILAKQLASRGYYNEVQRPYRSLGWHCDPTQAHPSLATPEFISSSDSTSEDEAVAAGRLTSTA
jgi:hypothetical protein